MATNDKLEKAIAARDKFLKDHPHLEPFQEEINQILDKTPEAEKAEVMLLLLAGKLKELQDKMGELNERLTTMS